MAMIEGAPIGGAAIGSSPIGGGSFLGSSGGGGGDGTEAEALASMSFADQIVVRRGYAVTSLEAVNCDESLLPTAGAILTEHVGIAQLVVLNSISNYAIVDGMRLVDQIVPGFLAMIEESVTLDLVQNIQRAAAVVESLGLSGTPVASGIFGKIISQVVKLRDTFTKQIGADVDDMLIASAELLGIAHWRPTMVEGVAIAVTQAPQLLVTATIADGVEISHEALTKLLFSAEVVEGIEIELAFVGPSDGITSWSINTRTGAVSEYSNFSFNSFAQVGSIAYGASQDGLYEMLGDDDAGDDIIARLKSGYMQFGGTHLSRLKEAYVAVRSADARVVMKIITADDVEYVYQVDTRSMRNTKVHMGKGQRARYFAFELVTEGQDFDLDTLEFVPIVVQRRV